MARESSILSEAIRTDLQRDCLAVGYTPGDASRLADRIIGGWLLPGLAINLRGTRLQANAPDDHRAAEVTR